MTNQLKIISVNCQGLGDKRKCQDVLMNLKLKKYNVYFIQDTHFTTEEENYIETMWGHDVFFNSYKSNSRGIAILFNDNCEVKVHKNYRDENGNYLILEATIDNLQFLLVNLYGPNSDTPEFYSQLLGKIEEIYSGQYVIIGGDFNLVLNQDLDTMNYKRINNPKAQVEVHKLMETLDLIDIFRENNPTLRRYTWRKRNPIKQGRLDFFLISQSFFISGSTNKV